MKRGYLLQKCWYKATLPDDATTPEKAMKYLATQRSPLGEFVLEPTDSEDLVVDEIIDDDSDETIYERE